MKSSKSRKRVGKRSNRGRNISSGRTSRVTNRKKNSTGGKKKKGSKSSSSKPKKPDLLSKVPNEIVFEVMQYINFRSLMSFRTTSKRFNSLFKTKNVKKFCLKKHVGPYRILMYYRKGGRSRYKRAEIRKKFHPNYYRPKRKVGDMEWKKPYNLQNLDYGGEKFGRSPQDMSKIRNIQYYYNEKKKKLYFVHPEKKLKFVPPKKFCKDRDDVEDFRVFQPVSMKVDYFVREDDENLSRKINKNTLLKRTKRINDSSMFKYVNVKETYPMFRLHREAETLTRVYCTNTDAHGDHTVVKVGFLLNSQNRLATIGGKLTDFPYCELSFDFTKYTINILSEGEIVNENQ